MANYDVVPIDGQEYEGRQWGWRVLKDGVPMFDCSTGGTGPCWNVGETEPKRDEGDVPLHICDLDDAIDALVALRDSEANKQSVARWAA